MVFYLDGVQLGLHMRMDFYLMYSFSILLIHSLLFDMQCTRGCFIWHYFSDNGLSTKLGKIKLNHSETV